MHSDVPRVLWNYEVVGDFHSNPRSTDVIFKGSSDEAAEELAREMGWNEELRKLVGEKEPKQMNAAEEVAAIASELEQLDITKDKK